MPALSPDAVVVRGGVSAVATLRDNAEDTFDEEGVWGVSAWVAAGMTVEELLDALGSLLPHPKIRLTTVGALEAAGFQVELTPPEYHVTIHLPEDPADEDLERLAAQFDPPTFRP